MFHVEHFSPASLRYVSPVLRFRPRALFLCRFCIFPLRRFLSGPVSPLLPLPPAYLVVMFPLSRFASFGFGGSRSGSPSCLAAAASFCGRVPAGAPVFTSCASGASAVARAAFPAASVFSASQFSGLGSAAFAARAAAMVRALAGSPSPLFVCFPGCPCPPSLSPARSWRGGGSGSWSECALAFGLGVPVLAFLPAGVQPPASWGAWSVVGGGWFFLPVAPSLF